MSNAGWRVTSWSRERGRGSIESDVGVLPFDASVADVDDFAIGEQVAVSLRRAGERFEVTRIAPKQFRSLLPPSLDAPLPRAWRAALRKLDKLLAEGLYRVEIRALREQRLELEIVHADWPPPHRPPLGSAVFEGVTYIQLPTSFDYFMRVKAYPWAAVEAHRPEVLERLSFDHDVEAGSFLICFEPGPFGQMPGFVVATELTTTVR
jgi:hypothetical protein